MPRIDYSHPLHGPRTLSIEPYSNHATLRVRNLDGSTPITWTDQQVSLELLDAFRQLLITDLYLLLADTEIANTPVYSTGTRADALAFAKTVTRTGLRQLGRDIWGFDVGQVETLSLVHVGSPAETVRDFRNEPAATATYQDDTGRRTVEINNDGGIRIFSTDRPDATVDSLDVGISANGLGAVRDAINQYLSEN